MTAPVVPGDGSGVEAVGYLRHSGGRVHLLAQPTDAVSVMVAGRSPSWGSMLLHLPSPWQAVVAQPGVSDLRYRVTGVLRDSVVHVRRLAADDALAASAPQTADTAVVRTVLPIRPGASQRRVELAIERLRDAGLVLGHELRPRTAGPPVLVVSCSDTAEVRARLERVSRSVECWLCEAGCTVEAVERSTRDVRAAAETFLLLAQHVGVAADGRMEHVVSVRQHTDASVRWAAQPAGPVRRVEPWFAVVSRAGFRPT